MKKILTGVLLAGIMALNSCNMNQSILEDEFARYIKKTYDASDLVLETFAVPRAKIKLQGQPEKAAKDIYFVKFSFTRLSTNESTEPEHHQGIAGIYMQHMYPLDEDAHHFFHFNRTNQPFVVDMDSLRAFVNRALPEPPIVTLVSSR